MTVLNDWLINMAVRMTAPVIIVPMTMAIISSIRVIPVQARRWSRLREWSWRRLNIIQSVLGIDVVLKPVTSNVGDHRARVDVGGGAGNVSPLHRYRHLSHVVFVGWIATQGYVRNGHGSSINNIGD